MNSELDSFFYSADDLSWFSEALQRSGVHDELNKHLDETMKAIDGLRHCLEVTVYKDENGVDLSIAYQENLKKERPEKKTISRSSH